MISADALSFFFPSQYERNNYRVLDASDGWNYLAVLIAPLGGAWTKIEDVLQCDPAAHPLVNMGHTRIADREDEQAIRKLRGELATFVCERRYADGGSSARSSTCRTGQRGTWVSDFFGNGKSHLLKMLCHLWRDTKFPDRAMAKSLVPSRIWMRCCANSTSPPGASGPYGRGRFFAQRQHRPCGPRRLGLLLYAARLPTQFPQARVCLWLHVERRFDAMKSLVEAEDRQFEQELNDLHVSGAISRAALASDPSFAAGKAEASALS